MDCILYIDLFFLWNFWMNLLILFLVRQITKTYRTLLCLLSAGIGAAFACIGIFTYVLTEAGICFILTEVAGVILMNLIAFGGRKLLWHFLLFGVTGSVTAGAYLYVITVLGVNADLLSSLIVSLAAGMFCGLLEKKSRILWKEEHLKAKIILEFMDRKLFATAFMDTGNKLYDPIFHKPVILADEKMIGDMLKFCKKECPEKLHFIPFHSVGREQGLLEGFSFDCVSISWQNRQFRFYDVIAAATKESLYKGKEYQVIFHYGLLQEG